MAGKQSSGHALASPSRQPGRHAAQAEAAGSTPVTAPRQKKTTRKRKAATPLAREKAQHACTSDEAGPEPSGDIVMEISEGTRSGDQASVSPVASYYAAIRSVSDKDTRLQLHLARPDEPLQSHILGTGL